MILRAGSLRPASSALVRLPPIPLLAALLLAGCQKDTDPGPGGVTVGEARALDEAAEMLEKRPAPPLAEATVPADLAAEQTAAATPVSKPTATPGAKPKP